MTTRLPVTLAALAAVALSAAPAAANPTGMPHAGAAADPGDRPANPNVGIDQLLGERVDLGVVLRDESERPVTLREAMNGKVTILVPVYFRCPLRCNNVLNDLLEGMRKFPAGFDAGSAYTVVTVSMDPKEHADHGAKRKAQYVGEYGRPGADAGWRFLTGKEDAVKGLLRSVGYRYEYDRAFKEYDHPSGIVILTPDGVISRYFLGIGYDDRTISGEGATGAEPTYRTLRLSLVEASDGKIGSLSDRLALECYRFNGSGYSLNIMRVVQVFGLVTMLLLGAYLAYTFDVARLIIRSVTRMFSGGTP